LWTFGIVRMMRNKRAFKNGIVATSTR